MTAPTEDLIARLEQWPNHKTGADYSLAQVQDQQKEAAQALRALQQEVERLREANRAAMDVLSEASCWTTTKDWTASDFREHVRAGHLHQAQLSNAQARSALTGSAQG